MSKVKNKLSEMQFYSGCHWCMANNKVYDQALALLRDETCSECGDSGKIILPKDELDVSKWREEPCPKGCKPKEPTRHTPCAGESGGMYPRPTGSKPEDLAHFARAEEIRKTWPEWMREINSLPNTTNAPKEPKLAFKCIASQQGIMPGSDICSSSECLENCKYKPKPVRCPFNSPCVGEAKIQSLLDDSGYYIYCLNCGRHTDTYKTEIEAIIAWNAIAEPKPDELVAKMRKTRLCFTNNVGEKPYYRCEDERMNIYVADDQLFLTIYPADFQGEYDEETAVAFCEIGEVLQEAAARIKQLKKAVEGYQENIDNQYQTIVTQREQIAEQQRRLRTKKEAE